MTTWSCLIPDYRFTSQNQVQRMHRHAITRALRNDATLISVYGRPLAEFKDRARVTFVRLWGKGCRPFDDGNLWGGLKLPLDAMKVPKGRSRLGLSIIVDDTPKWIELDCRQMRNPDWDRSDLLILACPITEEFDSRWSWALAD